VAILEARLGQELSDLVTQRGGVPLHAPALAELPDLDPALIGKLVASLETKPPKLAIFQTGVGTRALFAATDSLSLTEKLLSLLKGATVAARGPKPSGALRSRGVRVDRSAAEPFTTREVLDSVSDMDLHGARVVVQRYGTSNTELDQALAARGAEVIEIPTYRWSLPQDTRPTGPTLVRVYSALSGVGAVCSLMAGGTGCCSLLGACCPDAMCTPGPTCE